MFSFFKIGKRYVNNSLNSVKTNCKNYSEDKGLNCTTRRNCVDKCINKRFLKKYNSISIHSVIDKNEFEPYLLEKLKFNQSQDKEIEQDCLDKFNQQDCEFIYLLELIKPTYAFKEKSTFVNLMFEKFVEKEIEQSFSKLILNILNLGNIMNYYFK